MRERQPDDIQHAKERMREAAEAHRIVTDFDFDGYARELEDERAAGRTIPTRIATALERIADALEAANDRGGNDEAVGKALGEAMQRALNSKAGESQSDFERVRAKMPAWLKDGT